MVMIDVGDPKMARETLCILESLLIQQGDAYSMSHYTRVQDMIDQLDKHRPLGVDGKHGDLHTVTCGCEDKTAGIKYVNVTGNYSEQTETTVWTNGSTSYRHRRRNRSIAGSYWGEWHEGRGE